MGASQNMGYLREFGDRLQALREEKGVTQETMSRQLEIPRSSIAKWEKGYQDIKTETLLQLCEYLDTTADYLLFGAHSEQLDIHKSIGLRDNAITILEDIAADDSELGKERMDLLNTLLADYNYFSILDDLLALGKEWPRLRAEIKEKRAKQDKLDQSSDVWKDFWSQINERQERLDYLQWKHAHMIAAMERYIVLGEDGARD
jgi:transcriptional regulator with XRE-family HTH domain